MSINSKKESLSGGSGDEKTNHVQRIIRRQAVVTTVSFLLAVASLLAALIFSASRLGALDRELVPLIDAAQTAAEAGDSARANGFCVDLRAALLRYEPELKLISSHRDLFELLRATGELVSLGASGGRDSYITALSSVRAMLTMLLENEKLTFENIF